MFENLQNLVGGLLGGGGNGGVGTLSGPATSAFKKTLTKSELWDTALETASGKIQCSTTKWTPVGRYQVPAQEVYRAGYGSAADPDNQGFMCFQYFDDTATNSDVEHGLVRIVIRNRAGTKTIVVAEFRTDEFGSLSDRKLKMPLPEQTQLPAVGEDSYIEVQFMPDAAATIVKNAIGTPTGAPKFVPETTLMVLPVTVYQ